MGMFDFLRTKKSDPAGQSRPAAAVGELFMGFDDPALLEFMRNGGTESGEYVTASKALQNMAILRCTTLISEAIGMLPLNLMKQGDEKEVASDHSAHRLLKVRPNNWQTPYEFKSQMQLRALTHGNAYARIIWSQGRPVRLIPMDPDKVEPKQNADWTISYKYTRDDGEQIVLPQREVFHLRDVSTDGIVGLSRVKLAKEAIGIAKQAELAAARLFKNGVMAGGALYTSEKLSDNAYGRLEQSINNKTGAENAHKWFILEEGLKAEKWANTAADAQHIENRNHQIEEIARAFGVPRPLLMMDDTSWGSGIEQLGIFFVNYALQHWFTAWEQAINRSLLSEADAEIYYSKFNERALMRGTLKDQADFYAKALGAGGHSPWMKQNEVRELQDMPKSSEREADSLRNPMTQRTNNEPNQTT